MDLKGLMLTLAIEIAYSTLLTNKMKSRNGMRVKLKLNVDFSKTMAFLEEAYCHKAGVAITISFVVNNVFHNFYVMIYTRDS